ncbi:MAG: HD domain-containing protein [Leadbetterella sp.]
MLKDTFVLLLRHFADNTRIIDDLWFEIETKYSHKRRHYHTLEHLSGVLSQLEEVKDKIHDWETVLFTLFYHDVVYNVLKSDNEEKSAQFAEERLSKLGVSIHKIHQCKLQIVATKSHQESSCQDTNYFTDADLSVLGQSWDLYSMYIKNIRKEYAIYPDFMYNPGRKKVLNYFLAMDRIFKTHHFYDKFEIAARQNLIREINLL